jgi:hypothetical protein
MMRLVRRATLLVAFPLLASAATVYAECAWVLWRGEKENREPPWDPAAYEWRVVGLKDDRSACNEGIDTETLAWDRSLQRVPAGHPMRKRVVKYACFPDTVDPRGPKSR